MEDETGKLRSDEDAQGFECERDRENNDLPIEDAVSYRRLADPVEVQEDER